MPETNTFDKVLARVDRTNPDGCWSWTGCLSAAGYAVTAYQGGYKLVHRLVYETLIGPIPRGYHLDHLCRAPSCCNPAHLDPVTPGVNIRRGEASLDFTGYCRKGLHKITDPGVLRTNSNGARRCAECQAEYNRTYWETIGRPRRHRLAAIKKENNS